MNKKINQNITLAKRKNTSLWQAVIKAPDGKWRRVSTKTEDEQEAITFAFNKLAEWTVLEERGIPTVTQKKFVTVALKYKQSLQSASQDTTESQRGYIGIIDNWLIPFFGDKPLKHIEHNDIEDFDAYRREKLGRVPAKSTINKHNITLRSVMEYAAHQKWCQISDIPKLSVKGKGRRVKKLGYFEVHEFNALMKNMVEWRDKGDTFTTKHKRDVMRLYVFFMISTGTRAGKETLGIKWKHFEHVQTKKGKKNFYRVHIMEGKKAELEKEQATRKVLLSEECYEFITPLKDNKQDTDYVFSAPDGKRYSGFSEMFRNCCTLYGLRYSNGGEKRTLYSCRHTYATWKLQTGKLTYEKLKKQMGTSIQMLEQHYDHATSEEHADDIIV